MRSAYLLFLVPTIFSGGCAQMMAESGMDLSNFKSNEAIHAKFGEPCASGSTEGAFNKDQYVPRDAAFYEDYLTRRKLSTPYTSIGYGMILVMTLGTIEPLLVTDQLFRITKRTIMGQTLRVIYDADGKVLGFHLDGESVYLPSH